MKLFFSMSDLDNGINVVTMSVMYMAFQSPTIISWLYMVNRGKIQTTCWYILEVTGGFLFTVWNKHDNTLCCGAFWFGTLFFHFAMPSKRRSQVAIQTVFFQDAINPPKCNSNNFSRINRLISFEWIMLIHGNFYDF